MHCGALSGAQYRQPRLRLALTPTAIRGTLMQIHPWRLRFATELEMGLIQTPFLRARVNHLPQKVPGEDHFRDAHRRFPLSWGEFRIEVGELRSKPCFPHGPNLAITMGRVAVA
jgi:hypothetical protein